MTEHLLKSRLMVLGLGGVGCYASEGLTRAGVGNLALVDFDRICITNVNRQLHAFPSTVGNAKVLLMAERLKLINPEASIEPFKVFYEAGTSSEILAWKPDVIVDCIDNVTAKLHLIATCILHSMPIVTCFGASGRVDPTCVKFGEMRKTKEDPLAKTIRKNLWRKYRINLQRVSSLITGYSEETPRPPPEGYLSSQCGSQTACPNSTKQHHSCAKRRLIWGSSVFVTSTFGMTAASLVARFLTGDPSCLLKPVLKILPGDDPPIEPANPKIDFA